jgi:hypothetical protein
MCSSTLSLSASSGVGSKILEGCKDACQYAVDKLQATFNSVANWLPLLLIVVGLVAYLALARRKTADAVVHNEPPQFHLWKIPALFALCVTLLRFTLEKFSAPESLAEAVGIGWLTFPFAVYFAWKALRWRELFVNLALFILAARVPVVLLMVFASYLHWGTHYDISGLTHLDTQWGRLNYQPNSLRQHLHIIYLAQLVIMPIYNLAIGMITGAAVFFLKTLRNWHQARSLKRVVVNGR